MTEDRSLDDFVGGSSDASGESGDDADEASDPDAPEPAVATYRWDPDGVECAACGESVERLWTADADGERTFVCESCKEW